MTKCLPHLLSHTCLLLVALLASAYPARAQTVLLRDDFDNAATLTQSNASRIWTVYNSSYAYGTTQFGNQPTIVTENDTTFARLKLNTYNTNSNLKGTEMYSAPFARGEGKEFEARLRAPNLASGIVAAFWTYSSKGTWGTSNYSSDEIDFEILSKQPRNWMWVTNWNDWNSAHHKYMDGVHNMSWGITIAGLDWSGWNIYKIRWLPDRTEWYVNGNLIKSAAEALPDDPMGVRFNIWTPDSGWTAAYDANMKATTNPAANVDYYLDVDWVEVRPIATATPVPTPAAPSNLTATAPSASQINLTWTSNSSNESGFKIERSVDGITFSQLAATNAGTTSYSDTGLAASTTHHYRVYAYNNGGNSTTSNTADATTLPPVLDAPDGLTATAGNAQVVLSWTAVVGASSYNVKRATTSDGPYATIANAATTTATDTSVSNGTAYYYVVSAVNATGESANSVQAAATPLAPLPAAPDGLTATAGNAQVNLKWTDTSSTESGFKIESSTNNSTFTQIAIVGAGVTTYANTGLTTSTTYYYRVRAYNAGGHSAYSNTASAVPSALPSAPNGLTAVAASISQINLKWTDNSGNETGFKIERKTGAYGTYAQIATVGAGITTYSNTGLAASTAYYYHVRAYNGSGNSAYSNEANSTTLTPTPTPYSGTAMAIPGIIESENFDKGGQGVAYSDTSTSNLGGYYRTAEAVDIGLCTDTGGGYSIGWSAPGEWLAYSVNVTTAGTYNIAVRVASSGSGGTFHIEFNGVNKTGTLTVPNTGDWQAHQTIVKTSVSLAAGPQLLKLVMDSNGPNGAVGNFNYIQITAADTTPPAATITNPIFNYSYRTLARVTGTASDTGGSGLAQVRGRLYRYADNTYWNGSVWGMSAAELPVTGTTSWTYTLPSLTDGRYAFQAIARDGAGNIGNSSLMDFWIDNVGPTITVSNPTSNKSYSSVTEANGLAVDSGPGVAQVRGRLNRASDGYYWDGSAWVSGVREISAQGTGTWKVTFPSLTDGAYTFQAVGNDYVGNTTTSALVPFSITTAVVASTSPIQATSATTGSSDLSTAAASVATQSIRLDFMTKLAATTAGDPLRYAIRVNGAAVIVSGAAYSATTNSVTLPVGPETLRAGDSVVVQWAGLSDAQGLPLADGSWQGTAR